MDIRRSATKPLIGVISLFAALILVFTFFIGIPSIKKFAHKRTLLNEIFTPAPAEVSPPTSAGPAEEKIGVEVISNVPESRLAEIIGRIETGPFAVAAVTDLSGGGPPYPNSILYDDEVTSRQTAEQLARAAGYDPDRMLIHSCRVFYREASPTERVLVTLSGVEYDQCRTVNFSTAPLKFRIGAEP